MTYSLRAFVQYPELINNQVGVVAPLGELSKHALTYARETGSYRFSPHNHVDLITFESSTEEEPIKEVPALVGRFCSELSAKLFDDSKQDLYGPDLGQAFQRLSQNFGAQIEDLKMGRMVTDGNIWLPEWISFRMRATDAFVRLWYSDDAFRRQYSRYEYAFVAPVANLDDLHGTKAQVEQVLHLKNYQSIMEAIERERQEHPYTRLIARRYDWVNGDESLPMDWTVLVYGEAGTDYDLIRTALADWIVENSSYTREEWLPVLPDIFTPTEFIIAPLWHQYAIPNKSIQAGIHSPLVQVGEISRIASKIMVGIGYSTQERITNTVVMPHPYKSLSLLVTGSAANRDGVSRIDQRFNDYINVSQQSPDFARMRPETQAWIRTLTEMIYLAETLDTNTLLPTGYNRINREGILFVGRDIDNVMYLVASRFSQHALFEPNSPVFPEDPEDPESPEDP